MNTEAFMKLSIRTNGEVVETEPVVGSLSHVVRQACGYIAYVESCDKGWSKFDTDGGNPDLGYVMCSFATRNDGLDVIEIVVGERILPEPAQVAWCIREVEA